MQNQLDLRALAVDLDDTVLRNDKSISDRTMKAWEMCRSRGVFLIVATARSEHAAARFIEQLRPDAVISNAGSLARIGQRTVCEYTLSPETVCDIAHACVALGAGTVMAQTASGYYWNETDSPESAEYGDAIYTDFLSPVPPSYKITVEFPEREAAINIAARFPNCTATEYAGQLWWRFSPQGVNKLVGLQAVLKELNISAAQTAAFGDDYSDAEMLRGVGFGIAMGNAVDEVKKAAGEMTEDNGHDGVARWLEHRFLRPVTVRACIPAQAELYHDIQYRAFLPLLEKYQDDNINPAAESIEVFRMKMLHAGTDPYAIFCGDKVVGYVRVIEKGNGIYKLSALSILPQYQNQGIAQTALRQIEALYPAARCWTLDTIAQEAGNCHLYEKLGYQRFAGERAVNRNMTLVDYQKYV